MNKWIDERAWKNSLYICYALSIIIVITAGYNYTINIIGDTTSLMKVVWLICVCLFVAFGIFLGISVIITPLSELIYQIFRLILYSVSFVKKLLKKKLVKKLYFRWRNRKKVELDIDNTVNDINLEVLSESAECKKEEDVNKIDESAREALKKEFTSTYVTSEHKDSPIYDVFESLFIEQKCGAFAVRAFRCAKNDPSLKWLKIIPGFEDAKRLFPHKDAITGGSSNYSNALSWNYTQGTIDYTVGMLNDKLKIIKSSQKTPIRDNNSLKTT